MMAGETIKELLASGAVVPDRAGSKRLVPAPQSVVVPVEPTREMSAAGYQHWNNTRVTTPDLIYRAMLAAAPAPSSLAGGERYGDETAEQIVRRWADWINDVSSDMDEPEWSGKTHNDVLNERDFIVRRLSALSPEAPARDGVSEAELRDAIALILPLAKGYAHAHPVGSNQSYVDYVDELITLSHRHEAPAEGEVAKP